MLSFHRIGVVTSAEAKTNGDEKVTSDVYSHGDFGLMLSHVCSSTESLHGVRVQQETKAVLNSGATTQTIYKTVSEITWSSLEVSRGRSEIKVCFLMAVS